QPLHDFVDVDGQLDDPVELGARLGENTVEELDLGQGARITVEQKAVGGVRLGQPATHHLIGDGVRHVLSGVEVALDLDAQRCSSGDVGAEDVSGRDGRDAQPLGE